MRAVNRKQSIKNKSACGEIASPVGIPISLQDVGISLSSGGLELFTKIYGIFRVPENTLWDS